MRVRKVEGANFKPQYMRMVWNYPHQQQTIFTNNNKQLAIMKVQNIFPVSKVETNDTLKDVSREREQLYFRLAIQPSGNEETLTDAQKELLNKLGAKAKEITMKGQLTREISNVFPASILSDYIDGLDAITANDLTDEMQDEIVMQLEEILKGKDESGKTIQFLFTYYTFSVSELLKGTEYGGVDKLYTENGSIVRQRNNLYFGFFDDEEEAFSFMRGRLIDAIENDDLTIDNPNVSESKPETETAEKPQKPKISLRH